MSKFPDWWECWYCQHVPHYKWQPFCSRRCSRIFTRLMRKVGALDQNGNAVPGWKPSDKDRAYLYFNAPMYDYGDDED